MPLAQGAARCPNGGSCRGVPASGPVRAGGLEAAGGKGIPRRAGVVRVLPWLRRSLDSPEPAEEGDETDGRKNCDGRSPPRSSNKLAEVFNHTHKAP